MGQRDGRRTRAPYDTGHGTRLTRRGRALVAVLCLAVLLGGGSLAWAAWQNGGDPVRLPWTDGGKPKVPVAESPGDASESPGEVSESPPSRKRDESSVPRAGTGTFATARLTGTPVGTGTLRRYQVQVENGSGIAPDQAATEIQAIVAHPEGWARNGRGRFQLVAEAPDFVIRIASPDTADKLCGEAGLDTEGELNCETGKGVVVNLRRWVLGSPQFAGTPATYRHLIINHELGHALGLGHLGCPGPGRPAPVMMQQIKGLEGCRSNAWPFDANRTYLSGPAL
ncbi:DUF3152 domain-containing protein [Streptomyces sp. NPDC051561]|uniref:DUF3152 domain-containing protein n=1 Tax=Streptomyces sp. NPDC051561 TaxID=3365658 RepID=UPI00378FBFFB